MGLKSLHPAQNAELDFLRRAVDTLQEDKNRNSEAHNIKMRIWEAREELDTFVKKLRQEGYNI
jgi:hypothetical protein|tara:strand:- start:249 stop:437 length:189 start_codon:yes stop_codon:yes gene_type:complete